MPLSDEQNAIARSWVGEREQGLDDVYDRHLAAVKDEALALYFMVVETLRLQLARFSSDRAGAASAEGMSVSYTANIQAITLKLKQLAGEGLDIAKNGVTRLRRARSR